MSCESWKVEPFRAQNGSVLCWIGINFDIDDRKKAELYLAEGQRLAHTGSWAFSAGGFEYWSSELSRIHGLDPENKAPSIAEYLALVHPDDRGVVAQEIQRMLERNAGFDFTKRIVRPDGATRHVRCVGIPTALTGTSSRFIGTGIDVTDHEQLTGELRTREDELRQVLDLTPQLVTVYGPRRERLYANRVALAYFARKAGKSIHRLNRRTLERLQSYPWPGKVRELQNVIERSVILATRTSSPSTRAGCRRSRRSTVG